MSAPIMKTLKAGFGLVVAAGFLSACETLPADASSAAQANTPLKTAAASAGKTSPSGPPFSPVVEAGGVLYIAGHLGDDPNTREFAPSIGLQTAQTLQNIDATLKTVGSGLSDVVRCQVFMTDISGFADMNRAYRQYFPQNPPARTTVEVSGLAAPNALIEIECTAVPNRTLFKKVN